MPDWLELVKSRLGPLGLEPQREAEIIAELALHLEELYEGFRRQRLSEQEALERALAGVPEWAQVSHEIRRAACKEVFMNSRTKRFWLPGLTTLTLSYSFLYAMVRAGIYPMFIGSNPHEALALDIPWLLFMPVAAGIGAFWAKRAGGGRFARLAAGLFPVLLISAILMVILPLALVLDRPVPAAMQLKAFAFLMLNAVLVPGFALLLGTLPFLKGNSGRPVDGTSRPVGENGKNPSPTNHPTLFLGLWTRRRGIARA